VPQEDADLLDRHIVVTHDGDERVPQFARAPLARVEVRRLEHLGEPVPNVLRRVGPSVHVAEHEVVFLVHLADLETPRLRCRLR
jgi:hypothetical protein